MNDYVNTPRNLNHPTEIGILEDLAPDILHTRGIIPAYLYCVRRRTYEIIWKASRAKANLYSAIHPQVGTPYLEFAPSGIISGGNQTWAQILSDVVERISHRRYGQFLTPYIEAWNPREGSFVMWLAAAFDLALREYRPEDDKRSRATVMLYTAPHDEIPNEGHEDEENGWVSHKMPDLLVTYPAADLDELDQIETRARWKKRLDDMETAVLNGTVKQSVELDGETYTLPQILGAINGMRERYGIPTKPQTTVKTAGELFEEITINSTSASLPVSKGRTKYKRKVQLGLFEMNPTTSVKLPSCHPLPFSAPRLAVSESVSAEPCVATLNPAAA